MAVTESNPYTPPGAEVSDIPLEEQAWNDDGRLVVNRTRPIHSHCINCGAADDIRSHRFRFAWHNPKGCAGSLLTVAGAFAIPSALDALGLRLSGIGPGTYVVVFLGFLFAFNFLWRSAKFRMQLAVCAACQRRRTVWRFKVAAATVVMLAGGIVGLAMNSEWGWLGALGLVLLYLAGRYIEPWRITLTRVDGDLVWLQGPRATVTRRYPMFVPDLAQRT